MVRRIDVVLLDDLTGQPAHRTVVFGFEGAWFEMDLTDANADCVTDTLHRWKSAGRPLTDDTNPARESAGGRTQADRARSASIRSWAQGEGMDVPAKGRISNNVVHAYDTRASGHD